MIARRRTLAILALAAFALPFAHLASARAQSPSPLPEPLPVNSCATAIPDLPNDVPTAFAYYLDSAPTLRFLSALATVKPREQKRIFAAIADAAATPAERATIATLAVQCPNLDEIYGTTRALALVAARWKLGELHDPKRFGDFSNVVAAAVFALSAEGRLPAADQQAALVPFVPLNLVRPAAAATEPPSPCIEPDVLARPTDEIAPEYPPTAYYNATAGDVSIQLALNENGDVRTARIFSNTLRQGTGSDEVIRAALFAAAATTYAPEIRGCRRVAGVYYMTFHFSAR